MVGKVEQGVEEATEEVKEKEMMGKEYKKGLF